MPASLESAVRFLCCRFWFLPCCEKNLGVTVEHPFSVFVGNKLCTLNQEESYKGVLSESNKITAVDAKQYIHPTFMPKCIFFSLFYMKEKI